MRQARVIVCALGVAAVGLLSARPACAVRHQLDSRDAQRLEQVSPEAARLFAEGEALLSRGQLQPAEEAFAKVRTAVPDSALAARRHCEVLTELGQREQARGACEVARRNSHTVMDARAAVGALMTGSKPPTVEELAGAIRLAQLAKRVPEQPFGDAAMCEIAYRIGDPGMLKKCVEDLQRVAPNHYETRRWAAALHATPSWPYWLGWGALAFPNTSTALHALLRRGRGSARLATAGSALVAVAVGTLTSPAHAQESAATEPAPATSVERIPVDKAPADRKDMHWQLSEKFVINPDDPLSSVPSEADKNAAPMQFGYYIQDLSSEAAYAERKGDYAKAAKLWATLAKAVPDVAVGHRRACRAYESAGDTEKALFHCSSAITLPGALLDDYLGYSKMMLAKPKLEPNEIADLDAVADHLRKSDKAQPDSGMAAERITCELGVSLGDAKRLERCTEALNKSAKGDVNTLLFGWNLAMLRGDYGKARSLLQELKKTPFPAPALLKAEQATAQASAWWRRPLQDWRYAAGLGVVALGFLAVALFRRARNKPTGPATPSSVGSAAAAG